MKISKALLIVFLLFVLQLLITLSLSWLADLIALDTKYFEHYFGMVYLLAILISGMLVLHLFFPFKIKSWVIGPHVAQLNGRLLSLIVMSAIGLVFITRPFSDITRIWDIYVNGVSEPYFHEFNSHHYYRLITALILAPVIEELIFRKYIFTSLLQRYSLRVAFLVSCILFSLMHMPQLTNLIPTFMLGAACCLVYIKTKRIIYPILLHFTYNLVINLFVWIGAPALNWIYTLSPFDYRYWAIVIMGGLLGFLALKRIPISKP